ncbi:MAG: hypothetical protein ABI276_03775, partial [Acidimicrobiales bacterium]
CIATGGPPLAAAFGATFTTLGASTPAGPITPVASLAAVTPAPAPGQCAGHEWHIPPGSQELQTGGLFALAGWATVQGNDGQPLDVRLDVRSQDIAYRSPVGEQGTVERAFRLLGASRTPRPTAIGTRAGEFDFDPAGHRRTSLLGVHEPPDRRFASASSSCDVSLRG